jgi:holo-[acyl-carrier protein] synthase
MIVSVGIDIVEVYRIRKALQRTNRFAERVFTANERNYCQNKGAACFQSYAARFAAKEAFLKALKTGLKDAINWQDVEIHNDENGSPYFEIRGEAERILQKLGAKKVHLSISHTSKYAVAIVVLEK